jgi:hypothetical protein
MTHKPAPVSWDFRNDWKAANLGIPLRHVVRFLVDQTSSFCLGSEWFWANFKPCKTMVSMGYAMYILASDLLIHGCTRPQKYQRYWLALVTEAIRNTYSNHHETRYDATHGSIPQRMTLLTLFGIAQLWAPSIPLHSLNSPSWRVANYSLTSQFISIQSELAWAEALREQKWYLAVRFNGHTSLIPGLPAITKLWAKHWFDSKECTPRFDVCRPDVFHFGAMWWHPPFADNNPDQSQTYMSNPNMPCIHHPCPVLLFGLFNLGGVLYTPSQNISYPRQFGGKKN